jgi:hypothetical protein
MVSTGDSAERRPGEKDREREELLKFFRVCSNCDQLLVEQLKKKRTCFANYGTI